MNNRKKIALVFVFVLGLLLIFPIPLMLGIEQLTIVGAIMSIIVPLILQIKAREDRKKEHNDWYFHLLCIMFLIIVLLMGTGFMYNATVFNRLYDVKNVEVSTYYNCYRVTAPFGVFAIEGEGSISGFLIVFHGSFDFEMTEKYVTKFFDGAELKTKIFNAEETSLIIDGTFRLEKLEVRKWIHTKDGTPLREYNGGYKGSYDSLVSRNWKIHLPFLPKTNQTTTEWLIK